MSKARVIFHVDMDAFFASCEESINPSLKEKPLIVGGTKLDTRGIVSCPNYLARAKGVKTAMPIVKAKQLVPEANFIRGTKGLYSEYSRKVREILLNYTPLVQPVSIDEAFMDVTSVLHLYKNDSVELANKIKADIKSKLNITCSIGISSGKVFSKIASKYNKPDGVTYINPGGEKEFVSELEVSVIPGVGKSTQSVLKRYGINKIKDILKYNKDFYEREISPYAASLLKIANGIDVRDVQVEDDDRKSLSKERTFNSDTNDLEFLSKELYSLLEKCCMKLRTENSKAKCITVKVKYHDFTVNQKSYTHKTFSNLEIDFESDSNVLLDQFMKSKKKIRLLGVRFSDLIFESDSKQESLFTDTDKFEIVSGTMDEIRKKYNFDIIKFGKSK